MDFYLHRVKICRSKQDVVKVAPTWDRTIGNPKNYNRKAQAGSWDVGKVGEGIQEPSMVLVFLFLKLQYGPKGVYFTPTSSHCIYSFDYVLHLSKEVNKKDIHLLQVRSSMLWEEQKKRSEIIMNYGSFQDAVKKWKKKSESVRPSVKSDSLRPHGLCSPPGSSVRGILQARILEWIAIPFSRGSS